jgi:hypothetical protein
LLIDTDAQSNLTGYILGREIDNSSPILCDSMIKEEQLSPRGTLDKNISIVSADLCLSDISNWRKKNGKTSEL